MAIGPVSVLMAHASDALVRGWPWPEVDSEYVLILLASSLPAGVNGGIGAALASGWGRRGRLGVTLLPASLHAVAALGALIMDPREFLLFQLMALVFSVVMWPAGRLGQMIGWAIRSWPGQGADAEPAAAPDRGGR